MNATGLNKKPENLPLCPASSRAVHATHPEEVWLGIHFPNISLTAHRLPEQRPAALLHQHQGKTRLYQVNTLARSQGLETGMQLNAAYALCQNLHVQVRDTKLERNQLRAYAQGVMRFTPRIVLAEPDTLLLEARASLGLFGGLKSLLQQLDTISPVPHSIACAPLADAAELMARQGIQQVVPEAEKLQSVLGDIRLTQTSIGTSLIQQLARCGLNSLRDIWRLPRPDLARRFGSSLLDYLDQLNGQRIMPRKQFAPPEHFKARYDFDQETDNTYYVLYAAEQLLQQAGRFLQARASFSESICFYLIPLPQRGTARSGLALNVHTQRGGDRPEHFLPQIEQQLHRLDIEKPLIAIELRIRQFRPRSDNTQDLFSRTGPNSDSWPVLLDLLFARLGGESVYRLTLMDEHRPEQAWQKRPAQSGPSRKPAAVCCARRPLWLFRQAEKCSGLHFKLISDAERLESGWWEGRDQRREYYQGIAPSGRHCWLYRDLHATDEQWYVHGLFG